MSDTRKRELRALLARRCAEGMTQAGIAGEAGVSQPLVSQAMAGRLVAETQKVTRLFEYLVAGGPLPPTWNDMAESDASPRLRDALTMLTDGSPDGDLRLARLLDAIAAIRLRAGAA